ncbi:MAG: agmatinase [Anaeroplasmataceae bacterium]|nr:agmatinase [Anaeroplasmataceae bacterium]
MKEEFRDLLTDSIEESRVILTGIPYDGNASVGKGASLAPKRLRELSKHLPPLTKDGSDISSCKIFDMGDISYKGEACEEYFKRIEQSACTTLSLNKFNLFIGGDHSVAIPLQKAFLKEAKRQHKKAGIIHIDAHPDICDVYEGSPYSHACPIRRAIDEGFNKSDILLIGMRGFELQEIKYFEQNKEIEVFSSSNINLMGIDPILKRIKEKFNEDYLIYLSYDIDANDPCFAPGTGTPEPFGLHSADVLNIILSIFSNVNVLAMDLVEIAPPLDCNDITSWLGLKTLYEIFNIIKNKEE